MGQLGQRWQSGGQNAWLCHVKYFVNISNPRGQVGFSERPPTPLLVVVIALHIIYIPRRHESAFIILSSFLGL